MVTMSTSPARTPRLLRCAGTATTDAHDYLVPGDCARRAVRCPSCVREHQAQRSLQWFTDHKGTPARPWVRWEKRQEAAA